MIVTIIMGALVALSALAVVTQMPDAARQPLERRVGDVRTSKVEVTNALAHALHNTRVPGGIVKGQNDLGEVEKLALPGPTLRDLLEALVRAAPDYRWEVSNGVLNLVPASAEPALLETRIDEFGAEDVSSAQEALRLLLDRSEVKERAAQLGLNTGLELTMGNRVRPDKGGRRFSVRCRDVRLREALNAIVRAQGHGVWMYRETHWNDHHGFVIDMVVP